MPNGAVTSPNGEVTPQSDSFLGMLLELLKGRWTEREEQTGQPMGIQNVAALSALEFLKPPQKMVPTKNPKLLKMGLKEEMNPEYLQMVAMGAMSPSKMEKLAKLGGKFYHGGAEKIALKKGMTFHAGTKEAALERIGRYSQRNQPRAVYEVEIKPKKPYLKKGRILDERIPEDRTELYYLQNLPHKRDELTKLGHDVVPYINATEDVGSLSMMVLKRGSARMTGKMERGKTTHAGKWKPSAPTPVKFKMAEDFEYSGNWVGTVGGKEHKIWRETQTGGDTIQGWWYDEAGSFLGMTKKEAIEKLQSMAAGLGGR